jgi:hypothetical protein
MVVITHQDVGVNHPPRLLGRLAQTLEKCLPIGVVAKDQVVVVASAHHVINRSRILNSQRASHSGRVPRVDTRAVNSSILAPTLLRLFYRHREHVTWFRKAQNVRLKGKLHSRLLRPLAAGEKRSRGSHGSNNSHNRPNDFCRNFSICSLIRSRWERRWRPQR